MFIGGYFAVSRIFNINQRARDYLTERASEFLGVEFNASSAVILPWSISIKNAQLTLKNIPVKIEVNRIRISFNLFDLIKNRFKPIYGTKQIYLDRPVFTWILGQNGGKPGTLNLENIPIVSLKDIPFIRININRGIVCFCSRFQGVG
jgi:hypothetical protein